MLVALILVLLLLAIVGGLAVHKALFLIAVIALVLIVYYLARGRGPRDPVGW